MRAIPESVVNMYDDEEHKKTVQMAWKKFNSVCPVDLWTDEELPLVFTGFFWAYTAAANDMAKALGVSGLKIRFAQ